MTSRQTHAFHAIALAGLVLGALIARLLVFDRYLPVVDWGDELNMYTLARHWRGVEAFPQNNERLIGYPPLYIWLSMGVQWLVEQLTTGWVAVGEYIYALRLIAAVVGTLTTLCLIAAGWMLGGRITGWLAGLVWAFSPAIVPYETLAIANPFVFLLAAASIAAAIRAWQQSSFRWSTTSLVPALLAVYFKYPSVYVTIPWGAVTLALIARHRRASVPWLALQAGLALTAAAYLVWGYDLFRMTTPEAGQFTRIVEEDGPFGLLRQPGNAENFRFSREPFLSDRLFYGGIIAGAVAYALSRWQRWRTVEWRVIAVLGVYAAAGIIMTSTHTIIRDISRIRFVLPVTAGLVLIWALAITQVTYALHGWLARTGRAHPLLSNGLIALVTLVFFVPAAVDLSGVVEDFRRTDSRVHLWRWSDTNVPAEGRILMFEDSPIYDAWNRPWRGYDGVTGFDWWFTQDIAEETPARWWERQIAYFAYTDADRRQIERSGDVAAFDAYLDDLLLLKHIAPDDPAGPRDIWFYRMLRPEVETDAVFGEQIRLVGYDLDVSNAHPGDSVVIRPYWQAIRAPEANYSMFAHLYPPETEEIRAQADGPPTNETRLTLTWDDPQEVLIGAVTIVALPDDLPPGEYRLAVGLYDWQTSERLRLPDGAEFVTVPVTVQPR